MIYLLFGVGTPMLKPGIPSGNLSGHPCSASTFREDVERRFRHVGSPFRNIFREPFPGQLLGNNDFREAAITFLENCQFHFNSLN